MLIVGIVTAFIKALAELVKLVESPGFGQEKKEAVLEIVATMYDELNKEIGMPISRERVLSIASTVIDVLVGLYNLMGIFRTKNSTQGAPNNQEVAR